jgi:DNA polymerase-3 subunit beta
MKISVLQENLSKGLSIVSRSVNPRGQLPVLGNVLLTTDRGRLKLSATNLETGINYWVGAKIEEEGAISIPAKILTEFISSLPAEKIDLKLDGASLKAVCGSSQASFVGLNASEFPAIPSLKGKPEITFKAHQFSEAISQVAFAAAADEGNPVLSGVLLAVREEKLYLVATDGYRLSLKEISGQEGAAKVKEYKKGLLIPARALMEVGKIIGDVEEEKILGLVVTPEANQVIFVTPECEVVSRLIEGDFPDFEKILPEKGKTKVSLEVETLRRTVRLASIFARDSANIIRFSLDKSGLKISANTAQVGENQSQIEVKVEGENNKIAFNSRYLLDFLNSVKSELVNFEMTGALNPGVFSPAEDKNYLHIIMPVRLQE